jgi:hypothetical protein
MAEPILLGPERRAKIIAVFAAYQKMGLCAGGALQGLWGLYPGLAPIKRPPRCDASLPRSSPPPGAPEHTGPMSTGAEHT